MTAPLARRLRPLLVGTRSSGGGWPLARIFGAAAAVVGLFAVAAIVLGSVALAGLNDARAVLLDRVSPALDAGQRLSVALLDQETGIRGYDLTGRADFLEPYRSGVRAETDAVAVLRATPDLDDLGPELDGVVTAAQRWRERYAEPTIAATGDAAQPMPDPIEGRALFDGVRSRTEVLLRELENAQEEARAGVGAAASFLLAAAVAVAVVLLLVIVAAGIGLRRTVLRPVSDLAAQVRAVVTGDAQQPVRATGPAEIVGLGEDVEAMRTRILSDLDESQETNRRLDERTRDLERSNRDLEQFAYVASHDLQEPLRKVSSFSQLLQRRYGGQLDDRADQYIEFAVDGAQRMQQLINDLLAFSRVGRTTEGFTPVALDAVAASVVTQLEPARAEVDGEIVVHPLPEVVGDAALLRQLLANLVANGLKFHREAVPPVVEVAGRRVGDVVEVTVADNGIGIDAEYADKVFVIFQRLHAREVYPGTGIGLALAKKIVEFHGGRIGLEPGERAGTTVRVTLPAQPVADDHVPEHHAPEESTA
ncbi:ATP-binding protein [Pseudonocardia sp.]|uniref:sensor histidine kinase n=1 Tax=Pseudonocardia sp. TaxID=60912 RepID=UPI00263045A0|nr:ATP-binding protein [Pseudonocardia sp.]